MTQGPDHVFEVFTNKGSVLAAFSASGVFKRILNCTETELIDRLNSFEARKGAGLSPNEQQEYDAIVAKLFHPEQLVAAA